MGNLHVNYIKNSCCVPSYGLEVGFTYFINACSETVNEQGSNMNILISGQDV